MYGLVYRLVLSTGLVRGGNGAGWESLWESLGGGVVGGCFGQVFWVDRSGPEALVAFLALRFPLVNSPGGYSPRPRT